jgi:hypothetical protein
MAAVATSTVTNVDNWETVFAIVTTGAGHSAAVVGPDHEVIGVWAHSDEEDTPEFLAWSARMFADFKRTSF